jgi:hypothetical protein
VRWARGEGGGDGGGGGGGGGIQIPDRNLSDLSSNIRTDELLRMPVSQAIEMEEERERARARERERDAQQLAAYTRGKVLSLLAVLV